MVKVFNELIAAIKAEIQADDSHLALTLENIFSFREVGNKTHGDLAEVALCHFIRERLSGWQAEHVGKSTFRAKKKEEDIRVTSPQGEKASISIKAYGVGPLQLSTNKTSSMFKLRQSKLNEKSCTDAAEIQNILADEAFSDFQDVLVLPLIYEEKKNRCKIMVFNWDGAVKKVVKIDFVSTGTGRRKHPIYVFKDKDDNYLFEVRYGDVSANALQRGLWTHTENSSANFVSITDWVEYRVNRSLIELVGLLLVTKKDDHAEILKKLKAS